MLHNQWRFVAILNSTAGIIIIIIIEKDVQFDILSLLILAMNNSLA